MPLLAVLGIGALVGLAGYVGYHAVKHFFFHDPWDLSWKGAGASLAAGAVALPAVLFGSGLLAGAAGLELTPLAIGGATSVVGAITGAVEDPSKKPQAVAPTPAPVANPPAPVASADLAPVTTAEPAAVTSSEPAAVSSSSPVAQTAPSESAPVDTEVVVKPDPNAVALKPLTPPQYTVKKHDTLTAIAKQAGVTLAELEKANPQLVRKLPAAYSSPWDYIRTGEKINMPSKTPGVTKALDKIGAPANNTDE